MTGRRKVGVLASGRGSNLQALLDAARDPAFPAEIVLVLCNVPGAKALERAESEGIATLVIDHKGFSDRASFDAAVDAALREAGVEIVCLAGFMRILTAGFVEGWSERMLNVHPSLLPAFKGLDTHARAIAAGTRFAGCTVHLVTPDLDDGPILVQAAAPVHAEDDADSLAARVLELEHVCYPFALRLLAEGRVRVENGRAIIDGANGVARHGDGFIAPAPF